MKNPLVTSKEPTVTLSVGGDAYANWAAGSVRLSMEELANTFEVEWVAEEQARGIYRGDAVELAVDGDVVIDGYVFSTEEEDAAESITMTASGMSKAGDLLDCSALNKPGRWNDAKLSQIAKELCDPFGVEVEVIGDEGAKFPHFAITKGETPYDVLARLCAKRGLIPYSVGGKLVLAKVGTQRTRTVLERGKNVVRWGHSDSDYGRHSQYRYVSQIKPATQYGAPANQVYEDLKDEGVTRYRPLLVQAEAHDPIDLKNRAKLERNQRAGAGERISCVVNEWLTDEGYAWRPNLLVRAKNATLGIDADFVIVSATYRLGADVAREVELVLAHPASFDMAANYPARKRAAKWT